MHEAESEESYLGLGIMPSNKRAWFDFRSKDPEIIQVYDTETQALSVEFSLDSEVIHHIRSIYTFFDLLGDVGGLFDAMKGIAQVIVAFYFSIFGNPLHGYILNALFLRNPKQIEQNKTTRTSSIKEKLDFLSLRTSFELSKALCVCFRSKKEKKLINRGINRIQKELEIDRFLKTQMRIKIAMRRLFSKVEQYLIRNNRCFVITSTASMDEETT